MNLKFAILSSSQGPGADSGSLSAREWLPPQHTARPPAPCWLGSMLLNPPQALLFLQNKVWVPWGLLSTFCFLSWIIFHIHNTSCPTHSTRARVKTLTEPSLLIQFIEPTKTLAPLGSRGHLVQKTGQEAIASTF